ncbi:MAG: pyridoxine 5'-phosphate synthase [Pseudomonadales bacterium]|nr:pyridoxine 5'-phosphate synthase [Pseudomonadales bacterium]
MPIALSLNLNKIALIRNSRPGNNPDLLAFARQCLAGGAHGITIHPRPDQRHIRPEDCAQLAQLVQQHNSATAAAGAAPAVEFNIEGNPFEGKRPAAREDFNDYPGFIAIIERCQPDQATLVPDAGQQLTSDHGFDLIERNTQALQALIARIKAAGSRVSLFMDPDREQIARARDIGADHIELYTGPFANAFASNDVVQTQALFEQHCAAAEFAHQCELGVNAGHDLNTQNLAIYRNTPHLREVSIGHAFTIDALQAGLDATIQSYLKALQR